MATESMYYQLVLDLQALIFKVGDPAKVLLTLYDNTKHAVLSEQYCLNISHHNFPLVGSPEDQKILFQNIPVHVIENSELYLICFIYRIGGMEAPDVLLKRGPKKGQKNSVQWLRPYGASVFRLVDNLKMLKANLGKRINFEPSVAAVYQSKAKQDASWQQEQEFIRLPFYIINGEHENYHIAPMSIGIAHNLTLYRGDVDIVEQQYEHFKKCTVIDHIYNGQWIAAKGSMFVTLLEASVFRKRHKSPYNVQITMSVRHNDSYQAKAECIRYGKGLTARTRQEVNSVIFYHNNQPVFNQTFEVLLQENDNDAETDTLKHYHLYFECDHAKSGKKGKRESLGFAFIRLSDIVRSTYAEMTVPLYASHKKLVNCYLKNEAANTAQWKLQGDGSSIKIATRMGDLSEYFSLLVWGYIRQCEKELNASIPDELFSCIMPWIISL